MSFALTGFLVVFIFLMVAAMPVAWAMAVATVSYMALSNQWSLLPILPEKMFGGMDVFILSAIPMFLLAGEVFADGGIARRLVDFADALVGWMRGGLAQVAIGACVFYSGITGVALGEIAALGRIFIPAMVKAGYTPAFAAAVIASASIIGPTIPPSLPIIVYGSVTNVSIGGMFLAAIFPGLVIAAAQMVLVNYKARQFNLAPMNTDRSWPAIGRAARGAILPMGMPVLILGSIIGGVMTPTEAAGASVVYALAVAMLIYRSIRLWQLRDILGKAVVFSGQLIIIVACGSGLAWVLGFENVTGRFAEFIAGLGLGPAGTMILFNILFLILGMFIDPSASIILFGPIVAPAAAAVGIDPLQFGVVVILNLNIGLLTPPLGVSLFASERIADCGLTNLIREVMPFIFVNIVGLALVSAIPAITLTLPRAFGF
jgi:tripartite ATP-independent transporter DctM subunit